MEPSSDPPSSPLRGRHTSPVVRSDQVSSFLHDVCVAVQRHAPDFGPREAANTLYGAAKLRGRGCQLGFSKENEATLLNMCARLLTRAILPDPPPDARTVFKRGRGSEWRSGEVSMMMWGIAYSETSARQLPPGFMEALMQISAPLLAHSRPHEVATLLWALVCIRADPPDDAWLGALWNATGEQMHAGDCGEDAIYYRRPRPDWGSGRVV
jgi:hypothetical protein